MLLSFGILLLVGLSSASLCQKIKLPKIIGMLFSGIILGPYALNFIAPSILDISPDLRQIALIIILIKAGLSLDIGDLKKVGRPAALMAFLPASFEIVAFAIFAPILLGINLTEALLMGAVLAAVSPAIVVPRMTRLIENKYGTDKSIPQLILAGASCDDVFVIVLFTTFTTISVGGTVSATSFWGIPISIALGVIAGALVGIALSIFFEHHYERQAHIQNSVKVIIILALGFILISLENYITIPFSGLLAVVSMACSYKIKTSSIVINDLSQKFGKLWIIAEIVLFVLIGATVDTSYIMKAGLGAIAMILIGLLIRSIGVLLCLIGTNLTFKERLFCVFAYLPKATVQAAIGAVPLSLGLSSGNTILSVAVMSILITAPLGAIAIDCSYKKLLKKHS